MKNFIRVVSSEEMARIEKLSLDAGSSEIAFMEKAGIGVENVVADYLAIHPDKTPVTIFAGKGNNGGDAYIAAIHLSQKGYPVEVYQLYEYDLCSALCQVQSDRFARLGGVVHHLKDSNDLLLPSNGVVVDGLLGTGFKGKALGLVAQVIEKINGSSAVIFSIDIPSGLSGNTGAVGSIAVRADYTIYLELPKLGFFLDKGWDYVGKLIPSFFGLEETFLQQAQVSAYLPIEPALKELLPLVKRTRHKYEAGYVLAIAGSESMPGAAILCCSATLHAGAGMIRLYHPFGMEELLSSCPPEVIKEEWDFASLDRISSEMIKATSLLIGPGLGRQNRVKEMVKKVLSKVSLPMVIDADALFFLAENPSWILPENAILTPHRGEMNQLLATFDTGASKGDFFAECALFAKIKRVVLVVKGAPTIIFCKGLTPVIIPYGDPGMATAGSGDVLTGIIAALLAQKMEPFEAAILGVYLHAKSGEYASMSKTSYCMVASDIIADLPKAFKSLLKSK